MRVKASVNPAEPRFIDREAELKALEKLARQGSPSILYVYGPEGCGKTRLLKEFIKRFNGIGVYLDALEEESVNRAITLSPALKEVKNLIATVSEHVAGPIGRYPCKKLWSILDKIALKTKLKGKNIVIAIDDVARAVGLDEVERYIKWLYELRLKLIEEQNPESVLIIATTSEGYSLKRVLRHTYNLVNLIWNLDRQSHEKLASQLNPPSKEAIEKTWRLTGGNPRRLIEIAHTYRWNVDRWFLELKQNLGDLANELKAKNLAEETIKLAEDPDVPARKPTAKPRKAYETPLEQDLMVCVRSPPLSSRTMEKQKTQPAPRLGIGKHYAWQIPAYKHALKNLLTQQT